MVKQASAAGLMHLILDGNSRAGSSRDVRPKGREEGGHISMVLASALEEAHLTKQTDMPAWRPCPQRGCKE